MTYNNDLGRAGKPEPALSPSATEPLRVSSHSGDGQARGLRLNMPHADVVLHMAPDLGIAPDYAMSFLTREIPWKAREINIAGRKVMQPRLTSWHGDPSAIYTYSGRTHHPAAWTPTLLRLKSAIERIADSAFNSVLLNRYPDGRASIGMHSDDEPELGDQPVIASISLGAERVFRFRPKSGFAKPVSIALPHGSVLVMQGETQRWWQHGINKTDRPCGERINLTFRLTAVR